jgi:hypothetical protein
MQVTFLVRILALLRAGSNMAARIAMIAITTNNSIKVKPVVVASATTRERVFRRIFLDSFCLLREPSTLLSGQVPCGAAIQGGL